MQRCSSISSELFLLLIPRRFCYRYSKQLFIILSLSTLFGIILLHGLHTNTQKSRALSFSNTTLQSFPFIQVPPFLILHVNANRRLMCKQVFQHAIPNMKSLNINDKNLLESFFGTNFNAWYISYKEINESLPSMQGKFCSNTSNEWFSLIVHQNEQSMLEDKHVRKILSDTSRNEKRCVYFNFNKCSLGTSSKDYPKIFELQYQQIIKEARSSQYDMPIETFHVVSHYIRRKAADYVKYQDKLTKIIAASANISIIYNLVTSEEIYLKFEVKQKEPFQMNLKCSALLREKRFNRTQDFQTNNATVVFIRLAPATRYNICASCEGMMNYICGPITTLNSSHSRVRRTINETIEEPRNIIFYTVISISAAIMVTICTVCMLYFGLLDCILLLFGPECCACWFSYEPANSVSTQRQDDPNDGLLTNGSSRLNTVNPENIPIGVQETYRSASIQRSRSLLTIVGQSVRELGTSISSINIFR